MDKMDRNNKKLPSLCLSLHPAKNRKNRQRLGLDVRRKKKREKQRNNRKKTNTLTMRADADVASSVVHAGSFPPLLRHRVETAHGVEVLVTVESADHVDEVVQGA